MTVLPISLMKEMALTIVSSAFFFLFKCWRDCVLMKLKFY